MHLLDSLSDNQLALVGCLVALLAAGAVMSLSYYLGRYRRPGRPPTRRPAGGDEHNHALASGDEHESSEGSGRKAA